MQTGFKICSPEFQLTCTPIFWNSYWTRWSATFSKKSYSCEKYVIKRKKSYDSWIDCTAESQSDFLKSPVISKWMVWTPQIQIPDSNLISHGFPSHIYCNFIFRNSKFRNSSELQVSIVSLQVIHNKIFGDLNNFFHRELCLEKRPYTITQTFVHFPVKFR